MSRERVVTGTDERGRPVTAWADPEPDTSVVGYGFMEPAHVATVERRKATPQELDAARAREDTPTHLVAPSISKPSPAIASSDARMQASRMNGAARHVQVMAARKATPKEKTVSEAATNGSANIPGVIPSDAVPAGVGFDRLAMAAEGARTAWDAKAAADTAWDVARDALAAAYASVEDLVEPLPAQPDDDHVHQILTIPIASPAAVAKPRRRSRSGEGQRAGQASERDRRAAAVMAAMERLGDDQAAVAAELGMKKNAVAQIVKHARLRAAATA